KKTFSKSPIDYAKLRKDDIHHPKIKGLNHHQFKIKDTLITEINSKSKSQSLVLFCHGGGYVSGPGEHHWNAAKKIAKSTSATVWMVDYPKAPEHKIDNILENILEVYNNALEKFSLDDITLIGDSVGGALILSLTQLLVKKGLRIPDKLILISPVVDATLTNVAIEKTETKDPMLSKAGVLSAKKMCALNGDLSDERISPINVETKGLPPTYLFIAENDITGPDQILMAAKLKKDEVAVQVFYKNRVPHIWPLLPILKEGKKDFDIILKIINKE
ncbi:MAG: alpha/beta hydrolase, partial [Bacteroidota bacterium]